MSRTAVVAFVLTLFILGRAAFAAPCGDRLQGFNTYEDMDDNMQPETGLTIFDIDEYSPHTSFEGVLVKAPEDARLEIEVLPARGGAVRKEGFSLERSDHKRGYRLASGFDQRRVFKSTDKSFVLRVRKADGAVFCEEAPKPVYGND